MSLDSLHQPIGGKKQNIGLRVRDKVFQGGISRSATLVREEDRHEIILSFGTKSFQYQYHAINRGVLIPTLLNSDF